MPSEAQTAPEPVQLSALQHYMYCPRQYALIYIEQTFEDNAYTQRGNFYHRKVETAQPETLPDGTRVERSLPIFNDELGLVGKADVVEFKPNGEIYPVEYKHGKRTYHPLKNQADELQLAGQALCLEFMFGKPVPTGAVFHIGSKKRRDVTITPAIRQRVLAAAAAIRLLQDSPRLPAPPNDERCRHCSLRDACQPEAVQNLQSERFEHWQLLP